MFAFVEQTSPWNHFSLSMLLMHAIQAHTKFLYVEENNVVNGKPANLLENLSSDVHVAKVIQFLVS